MARSGGRYVLENGRRRLVNRTESAPRTGDDVSSPSWEHDATTDPENETELQPAATSEPATEDEV